MHPDRVSSERDSLERRTHATKKISLPQTSGTCRLVRFSDEQLGPPLNRFDQPTLNEIEVRQPFLDGTELIDVAIRTLRRTTGQTGSCFAPRSWVVRKRLAVMKCNGLKNSGF